MIRPLATHPHAPTPLSEPKTDARTSAPEVDADRARIEWLHERSGEVELLISGALLFGLLQLPGAMEGWFDRVSAGLARDSAVVAFLVYF